MLKKAPFVIETISKKFHHKLAWITTHVYFAPMHSDKGSKRG